MVPGNTTEFSSYSETADHIISIILIVCTAVGVPGNLFALNYFVFEGRGIARRIYIIMTITDSLICSTSFPVVASFLNQRKPMIFGNPIFCTVWGSLWNILPYLSVCLIAMLSITRTMIFLNKGIMLSKNKIVIVIGIYTVFLTSDQIIPLILHFVQYKYAEYDGYCWETNFKKWLGDFDTILNSITLALPILPIMISCSISTYFISSSINPSRRGSPGNVMKRNATITILMVTLAYIIFNVPVFINYILYTIVFVKSYPYPNNIFYKSTFMYFYSWNFTYIICTTVNSCINPVIYFIHMSQFRRSLVILFRDRPVLERRKIAVLWRDGCKRSRTAPQLPTILRNNVVRPIEGVS